MSLSGEDALVMAMDYTEKSLEGAGALKGQDGKDGKDGVDGKSAYQIALDNGFKGTEEEWLESLKGSGGGDNNVQADWNTEDVNDDSFIRNKPDLTKYVKTEDGKGLSSNDFTDAYKDKIDDIPEDAKYTDTTYENMTGATSSVAGKAGLVPAPKAGAENYMFCGDGTWKDATNYAVCNTDIDTAAKTVTIDGFKLYVGVRVYIKFANMNHAASPTLNVNGTGAKPIMYHGQTIDRTVKINEKIREFVYDGTYWQLTSDNVNEKIYNDTYMWYNPKAYASSASTEYNTAITRPMLYTYNTTISYAASYSVILGGFDHAVTYPYTAIIGGSNNGSLAGYGGYFNSQFGSVRAQYGTVIGGRGSQVNAEYGVCIGYSVSSSNFAELAIGKYSKNNNANSFGGAANTQIGDAFKIGNGIGSTQAEYSNAFRVSYDGSVYGTKAYNSSGADYAEYIYEWSDGNANEEDRVGYFVTVKGKKISIAEPSDFIAGITSGNPSVLGNADEDYYWRYERDAFNRIVMEDVEEMVPKIVEVEIGVPDENGNIITYTEEREEVDENGKVIMVKTGNIIPNGRMKVSDSYDASQSYISRNDRKEWNAVGLVGIIPVRDDGTCEQDGFCKCGYGGIATMATVEEFATNKFVYRVLERVSENVIKVLMK